MTTEAKDKTDMNNKINEIAVARDGGSWKSIAEFGWPKGNEPLLFARWREYSGVFIDHEMIRPDEKVVPSMTHYYHLPPKP